MQPPHKAAEYTPGPWPITDTCNDLNFCVVRIGNKDVNVGSEANAHLIAAAPELLEALTIAEKFVAKLELDYDYHDYTEGHAETALAIRAALAKAKGQS